MYNTDYNDVSSEDVNTTRHYKIINTLIWLTLTILCIIAALLVIVVIPPAMHDIKEQLKITKYTKTKKSEEIIYISNISDINRSTKDK